MLYYLQNESSYFYDFLKRVKSIVEIKGNARE
jgi:hypothetical protein